MACHVPTTPNYPATNCPELPHHELPRTTPPRTTPNYPATNYPEMLRYEQPCRPRGPGLPRFTGVAGHSSARTRARSFGGVSGASVNDSPRAQLTWPRTPHTCRQALPFRRPAAPAYQGLEEGREVILVEDLGHLRPGRGRHLVKLRSGALTHSCGAQKQSAHGTLTSEVFIFVLT